MKIIKEFKEFALKGNFLELAVGIVIGGAFTKIVNSFVSDLIMPSLSLITRKIDFNNLFIALNGKHYTVLSDANKETSTINYGSFITTVINFLVIASSIFIAIKAINFMRRRQEAEKTIEQKDCPFCKTHIHAQAVRCPNCTSKLE
jgi:large conductance mechanosensitive channel